MNTIKKTLGSILCALAALVSGNATVMAQDAPKADAFVGYTFARINAADNGVNTNGFTASVTGNLTDSIGLTGEVNGIYKNGNYIHFLMGGPRFTYRENSRVEPFAHVLAGAAFLNSSDTRFSMAVGGGVDVKINDKIAIRAVQADYAPIFGRDDVIHNIRLSTGVVFRF